MKIDNLVFSANTQRAEAAARAAVAAKADETTAQHKSATDTVTLGNTKEESVTYTPPKKLSGEQVNSIKEQLTSQQADMLNAMAGNSINQANSWLKSLGDSSSALSVFGDMQLPALATTQEGALAAISEGGAYSVDAVATRIFDMASAIAGDDPTVLGQMQEAVKKGFEAAGYDFKRATGQSLPDISGKTYDEVMSRFDARFKELGVNIAEE